MSKARDRADNSAADDAAGNRIRERRSQAVRSGDTAKVAAIDHEIDGMTADRITREANDQ